MIEIQDRLGCRSPLVLVKLGFDLRGLFDDVVEAPLPPRLQELSDLLVGYAEWRDVPRASTSK